MTLTTPEKHCYHNAMTPSDVLFQFLPGQRPITTRAGIAPRETKLDKLKSERREDVIDKVAHLFFNVLVGDAFLLGGDQTFFCAKARF
jgi:hypothetical protein